jgi:hypothetical protein
MKIMTAMLLATALAAPGMTHAADAAKAKPQPYKAALNANGQPDLAGEWTNASLTRLERDPKFGDRAAYTPAEAAALDSGRAADIANGNKPTDTSLTTNQVNATCEVRGFSGVGCGYNSGWTDPGDLVMRVAGQPRTSFITFPANGRVPASIKTAPPVAVRGGGNEGGEGSTAAARPGQNDNPEGRSLGERCIMSFGQSSGPVMQPQLYNNNYEIVQSKDSVGIWVEMVHDVKIVHIGAQHRTDGVRPWMGDSIGHYEGPTLVVETTNFPQAQALRGSWQNLKVTEKFTRVAKDRILYQFKVEDPTVWTQPWSGEYEFGKAKGLVYEYACHEGNYGLEGILAGARDEDRMAREKAADKPRADATR